MRSFSAATTGLPKLLKEEDIQCEYPSDIDDEYVTEKGFLPTLPGESSKVSAALALFRVSRILSKVLEKIYPAASSHDLSLQLLSSLDAELNEWSDSLPTHLKLTFVQDKPSTDITGDRSALLVSSRVSFYDQIANSLPVSCLLLYSHFNPSSGCRFHFREQGIIFCSFSRGIQQAYYSDRSASRREKHVIFILY
jgi:hypothetical protein